MKITLNTSQVIDRLLDHEVLGPRTEDGIITATRSLVSWLEDLEDDMGEEMELDPIGLRCQFCIYTLNDAAEMWGIDTSGMDEEDSDKFILEYLRDRTTVIEVDEITMVLEEF